MAFRFLLLSESPKHCSWCTTVSPLLTISSASTCLKWDSLLACSFIFWTAFFQFWKGFGTHTPPLPCKDWPLVSAFLHILQNAPWKLSSYSSHGKSFSHFLLYFREVAADDGTAYGLLEDGASFVESSSLSDPSLRLELADLEELEPKKLRISIFITGN